MPDTKLYSKRSYTLSILTKLADLWNLSMRRWEIAIWCVSTILSDNQYVRRSHMMATWTLQFKARFLEEVKFILRPER